MNTKDFSSLNLSKEILDNLDELDFKEMTPIQAESLPYILNNQDVLAQAKTGSGKTAAFGLGILNKLDVKNFKIQSIVLCPTRELADQVAKEIRRLARSIHNIKILTLCGGAPFGPQLGSLRHGAHIIVGTPGRILAHLDKGSLVLDGAHTLVLDEADRMLDMGFIEDIDKIIEKIPSDRQTLLFSATYPDEITHLSSSIQRDAVSVKTTSTESANLITECFYEVEKETKLSSLVNILSTYNPETTIVFTNMKIEAKELAEDLREKGIDALAIHGDLEQYQRTDVLVQFSNRSCSVLVATDVAARGLDIKALDMVINYDLAKDEATYTHRIGRTGRAGKEGLAFTIYESKDSYDAQCYENETRVFKDINELKEKAGFLLKPPNVTLVIEAGKKEKMRPGDILGALTGDAGLPASSIGKIDIYEKQSYVAIQRDMISQAQKHMKNGKIKGKSFDVWVLD